MFSPSLGFSLIASLIIVVMSTIFQYVRVLISGEYPRKGIISTTKLAKQVIAMALVLSLAVLYIATFLFVLFYAAFHKDSHVLALEQRTVVCAPLAVEVGSKNVVLRLDDVQAGAWADISIRMMRDALAHGMPVVAGVIPQDLGTNHVLQRFLWRHHCSLEFALHGYDHAGGSDYDHTIGEFTLLDAATARQKLSAGITELQSAIRPDVPIVTFIPPQNTISPAATAVLREFDISVLSKTGIGPYDYDAYTWDYSTNELVSARIVMEQCDTTFAHGDTLCVIMLHPQDFASPDGSLDVRRYREYQTLLALLAYSDVTIVRFLDVVNSPLLFDNYRD